MDRINGANDENSQLVIRDEIIALSLQKNKEWFKHIPGGEFLGSIFVEAYNEIKEDACMKQNVVSMLKWCGIKENDDGLD